MSSDYNVEVAAVDGAMDCFEHVEDAARSLRAAATFDIASLGEAISLELRAKRHELDDAYADLASAKEQQESDCAEDEAGRGSRRRSYDAGVEDLEAEIERLERRIARIEELRARQELVSERYDAEAGAIMGALARASSNGMRLMAAYVRKIQNVTGPSVTSGTAVNPYTGERGYAVAVIDSQLYPESANHLRQAAREGVPLMLTLDRDNADLNRKYSLRGYPVREGLDRDEVPPAAFAEGGAGAHVMYISQSDNRGSGSSFRRQLENVPNGTRVRFRVV